MTSIAIVGCGNAKLTDDEITNWIRLKELYTSNYFAKKREYAEIITDDWYILSAKYGLEDPNRPITETYDLALTDLTDQGKYEWAIELGIGLRVLIERHDPTEVHLLLGEQYRVAVEDVLEEELANGWSDVVNPFKGTSGIGEQMSRINNMIQRDLGPDQQTFREVIS